MRNGRPVEWSPRPVSMLARSCLKATERKGWPQPFGRFFIGGCFLLLLIGAQPAFMGGPLYGMRKRPKCIGFSIKTIPFSNSNSFFIASPFLKNQGSVSAHIFLRASMPCALPGNDIFPLGRGLLFCLRLRTPLQSDFSSWECGIIAWWQCLSVFDDLSDDRLNYGPRNPFSVGFFFL